MEAHTTWTSTDEARAAAVAEHNIPLWQALKENKKAILWSVTVSASIIMEGYDTALMPSFYGYPEFAKKYGHWYPQAGSYQLTSAWQAGLSNGATVGVVFGGFINGWASAKFGYKKVMLVSLMLMNAFIFIVFFAPSVQVLLVGELFCGLCWGVFATTGPAFASEVCPLTLRGYLTVFVNLCWSIGQFISSGVLKGLLNVPNQWAYRIPFAIQWVWPLPIFCALVFAPESPWWLLRHGRQREAAKSLARLSTKTEEEIRGTLAQMSHTIQIEDELEAGSHYWDCFKGVNLRRTEVCCMTFAGQMLSGGKSLFCDDLRPILTNSPAQFAYGPSYFFLQAGMSASDAYAVGIGSTALAFTGTILSWFLLTLFGRRTIYTSGIFGLTGVLLVIGIISASSTSGAALWAQASLCLVWQLIYSLSVGPICYAIISETSAIHLRPQTVVLSRNTYNIVTIVSLVLQPYMMNPTAWNWKGKTAFFWAGTAGLTAIWAFFRLPECKVRVD